MGPVPGTRSDRKLLVVTGLGVVLAGTLFAGVVLFATSHSSPSPDSNKPLFLGLEAAKKSEIKDGGPLHRQPVRGSGVLARPPGRSSRGLLGAAARHEVRREVEGAAERLRRPVHQGRRSPEQVNQYRVTIGSRDGSPKNSVFVDLHTVIPATG